MLWMNLWVGLIIISLTCNIFLLWGLSKAKIQFFENKNKTIEVASQYGCPADHSNLYCPVRG